jgi:hypothetical protein
MKRTKKTPARKTTNEPPKDAPPLTDGAPKEAAPVEAATPATSLSDQIDALNTLDVTELRKRFLAVLGRPTNSADRDALIARISERIAFGGKGAPAPKKAGRPIKGAPAKAPAAASAEKSATRATTTTPKGSPFTRDPRLPKPGSTIERVYKGKTLKVEVREDGLLYEREAYGSLSALARKITGADSINGFLFFGLTAPKTRPTQPDAAKPARAKAARKPVAKKAKGR